MSDRYRPPSGPKSTRNFGDERRGNNYKSYGLSDNSSQDRYSSNDYKRYPDRDNYRLSGNYDPYRSSPKPALTYRGSTPSGPSAQSSYRSNDNRNYYKGDQASSSIRGTKRLPPSEPKGFKNDRKRRDYNGPFVPPTGPSLYRDRQGYKSSPYENGKNQVNLNNLPKGPRSAVYNDPKKPSNSYRKDNLRLPIVKSIPKLLKSQVYSIKMTRPIEAYARVQQVGEGTYGKVYKAKNTITDEYVALKKLRLESEREGFPITAMREIKLLQSFDHENVVGLLEMMIEHNQIYMIFDYMDHDLTGLLTHPELKLSESHRKFIFKQLMEGLNYLHKKRVIHRDIKGSNILLDNIGRLKIADFGLARTMKVINDGESPDYTNRVITIWYRPPELLLGSTDYGREVDIWGVGCLLIELYSKVAAFQGFEEVGQLYEIFNIMGTPTSEEWPEFDQLPWFEMLKPKVNKSSSFKQDYGGIMSEQAFDLAKSLLMLNPKHRLTAEEALKHQYFTEDPKPEPLTFLKEIKGEWHEFETKKRRRKERKRLQEEKQNQASQNQNQDQNQDQNHGQVPLSAPPAPSAPSAPSSVVFEEDSKE